MQRVDNFAVARLNEAAISNHRQRLRRDVHLGRAGTQLPVGLGRRERNEQQSHDEWK